MLILAKMLPLKGTVPVTTLNDKFISIFYIIMVWTAAFRQIGIEIIGGVSQMGMERVSTPSLPATSLTEPSSHLRGRN